MALSRALKARLKRLYLEGEVPYAALVTESGLYRFEFQRLVLAEDWGPRPKVITGTGKTRAAKKVTAAGGNAAELDAELAAGPAGAKPKPGPKFELKSKPKSKPKSGPKLKSKSQPESAADGAAQKRKPALKPAGLLKMVYGTIEKELGKLEKQDGTKSQDRERASRALSQIMNSLEKAVEMQREIAKDETRGGDKKEKEALRNAESLRKEIVERIERFRAARAAGSGN